MVATTSWQLSCVVLTTSDVVQHEAWYHGHLLLTPPSTSKFQVKSLTPSHAKRSREPQKVTTPYKRTPNKLLNAHHCFPHYLLTSHQPFNPVISPFNEVLRGTKYITCPRQLTNRKKSHHVCTKTSYDPQPERGGIMLFTTQPTALCTNILLGSVSELSRPYLDHQVTISL